jgi:transposase
MVVDSSNGIASKLVINTRYKKYNLQQKREFIEEASQAGSSISIVARKYGLAPSVLFNWRRRMEDGALVGLGTGEDLVAASQVKELKNKIRELERLLGRKTVEVEILKEAVELGREKKLILRAPLQGVEGFR